MKHCTLCLELKALNEYEKDLRNKDGLQGRCRSCRKEAKQQARAKRIGMAPTVTSKTCNKCHETKAANRFYADAGIADGLATICKDCKDTNTAVWREANREEYNASMREYNAKNYHQLRLNRYGLTFEQYAKMLADQKGVCAIDQKPPGGDRPLCIDHDHVTGKVRGLLCYGCNRLMVLLDNPELLDKALKYKNKFDNPSKKQ